MFDVINSTKSYKIKDTITGFDVEVATFNANLAKDSNINVYMVINYPELYNVHKEDILEEYRLFNAEVTTIAIQMGLANMNNELGNYSTNIELERHIKSIVLEKLTEVIESIGDIRVNPVPVMDVASRYR